MPLSFVGRYGKNEDFGRFDLGVKIIYFSMFIKTCFEKFYSLHYYISS